MSEREQQLEECIRGMASEVAKIGASVQAISEHVTQVMGGGKQGQQPQQEQQPPPPEPLDWEKKSLEGSEQVKQIVTQHLERSNKIHQALMSNLTPATPRNTRAQ
jgi:hypothetical protein